MLSPGARMSGGTFSGARRHRSRPPFGRHGPLGSAVPASPTSRAPYLAERRDTGSRLPLGRVYKNIQVACRLRMCQGAKREMRNNGRREWLCC